MSNIEFFATRRSGKFEAVTDDGLCRRICVMQIPSAKLLTHTPVSVITHRSPAAQARVSLLLSLLGQRK